MVKVKSVKFGNFTVFKDATFEFSPGVNVLIGQNGTGKSHVMKAIYAVSEGIRGSKGKVSLDGAQDQFYVEPTFIDQVFLAENIAHLVRRGSRTSDGSVANFWLGWDGLSANFSIRVSSTPKGRGDPQSEIISFISPDKLTPSFFLPPREILSIFPGFISSWLKRESAFDRTYFDLAVALDERPLRERSPAVTLLLQPIEEAIGGKVVVENGRFYIDLQDGKLEAPLLAEGWRKLAQIAYLLVNGSLAEGRCLFWDEPEANMNPKLVVLIKDLLLGLARAGIQVFIATHDYLLSSELSLAAEYEGAGDLVRFFALMHGQDLNHGVQVQTGGTLAELRDNPILDEFAAHYDRESALFAHAHKDRA